MARTPFNARIHSAAVGNLTYTVPAGKFAVCNAYWLPRDSQDQPFTSVLGTAIIRFALNGVETTQFNFQSPIQRNGPLVFNAGDVISCPGAANVTGGARFGLSGFLYSTSTKKVPLNLKLSVGSGSYTVPAGKYVVVNFFTQEGIALVKVDGNPIGAVGNSTNQTDILRNFGPFALGSGQVLSLADQFATGAVFLVSGFIYNN